MTILLLLTGCADYQAKLAAQRAAQQQAIDQADDATCRSYGAVPGSEVYVACRMNIANNRHTAGVIAGIQQQQNSQAMMATGAAILSGQR
jgi:hypothetical protein